jgi:hypothetical protein
MVTPVTRQKALRWFLNCGMEPVAAIRLAGRHFIDQLTTTALRRFGGLGRRRLVLVQLLGRADTHLDLPRLAFRLLL